MKVMKTKVYLLLLVAGTLVFLADRLTAGNGGIVSPKTQKNLSTAMHGEAFAYAKYMLYAQHAREHGNARLAICSRKPLKLSVFSASQRKLNSPV